MPTAANAAVVPTDTVLSDNFNRSVSSGFGNANTGGSYSYGDIRNLTVDGSRGQMALTASVSRSALLKSEVRDDIDASSSFGVSALPAAGSVYISQMLRTDLAGGYLGPRVRIMPDKSIVAGLRYNAPNGASTTIGKDVTLPFKMGSASTRLNMRSQAEGDELRMKVWEQGKAEPSDWTVSGASTAITTPGYFGVWGYLGGGTNAISVNVDDVVVKVLEEPNQAPAAAFSSSVNDLLVAFDGGGSSDSDGSISSYSWDFGDGTNGTGRNPSKTYGAAGVYNVKLTVTDNRGATDTVAKQVIAIAPNIAPVAGFTSTVNDLDVAFDGSSSTDIDGSITAYAWDFGDGTTGTGRTVAKKYNAAGAYNVKLTVTDNRNGTNAVTRSVTAIAPNVLPTAAFSSTVNDLDVAFDGGSSSDSDGTITAYAWDFGDGTTGTGRTVSKKYNAPGAYNVKLTVTDNRGGKANVTNSVTAIAPNVLPTAAFAADITDLSARMDASGSSDSDGTIVAYDWDFGDGTTGTGKTVSKEYTPGNYTVKLTVTDNRGGKDTTTRPLTAIAPNVLPTAGFSSTVNDLDVAFDGSESSDSDGTIVKYEWNFGDGSTGTGKNVSKRYAAAGPYNVTLKVTDNRGGTATKAAQVVAIAPNVLPTAAFTNSVNDLTVSFNGSGSSDSDGTLTGYAWNFGDGTTGSGVSPTKVYSAAGTYTVTLTVTDNRGGTATKSAQVTAIAPNVLPTASFANTQNDLAVAVDASGSSDSDGTITAYAWEFGDGSTGSGKTANKQYAAGGTYTIKLTVTDNRGGKATAAKQVTVIPPNVAPTASFTATATDLTVAVNGSGSADSDGTITGYAWNFGDGSTATGVSASKTYAAAGTYTVTLTVTDNRGGTATTTRSVTATAPGPVKPSAANTGVPAGTTLTTHNGDLTITQAGTVIDKMDIKGYVVVKAPNVTIKRSIIRGGTTHPTASKGLLSIVQSGASGYLVEDVTLLPQIQSHNIDGVKVNQAGTFRRMNVSGSIDGFLVYGDGVKIENSYLHDFVHLLNDPNWGGGPSHDDAIQVQAGKNISITNNTIGGAYNAAVMITQDAGVTQNLSINNNWIDGGGCSLNYKTNGAYKTGMQANNNKFGRSQRNANCAIIHNSAASDLAPTGNVWEETPTAPFNGVKKGS